MDERLQPWYAIATPHEDIRERRLAEAVFAANLWAVVQNTAPEIYLDPEEFFHKTYMTVGLSAVLRRVAAALRGESESGDRIISLQTAFGGGKTHTLVALWHLAKHAEKLRKSPRTGALRHALGDLFPEHVQSVATFTNATCDATQGRQTPEGVHTRTLWGELALQLGGTPLYQKIQANDQAQRVPQGLFVEVLREAAPCLMLLDELADYCVGAAAVQVGETTLADQTISFIQQLTEAVQQVPGAVVVATLPASKYEVAQSEKGQEAFVTLEKRFQRLGADVKPVADDEIYEVVRARLFESITPDDAQDYPQKVAQAYQGMYAAHSGEVPTDAAKNTYREQIERSYPFHPLLIDALYTRWGSHPDFQRTRGVLRLLASMVGDLWERRESSTHTQHLIQPCDIRWSVDVLQAALTRFWGPAYQSVVAADVAGEKSNAGAFDEERGGDYRRENIGRGLSAAILLGSFGGQGGRSGFSNKDLKLACSRLGLNWNYADGALMELENRCFYLHTAAAGSLGRRYWFGVKPTLNKLVVQYRQQHNDGDFGDEILGNLQSEVNSGTGVGAAWRVLVNPVEDLPEQKALTLLVLPPSLAWGENDNGKSTVQKRIMEISSPCGGRDRIYRNTLLFLAPMARGLSKLRQAYRERAALEGVRADYGDQLDEEQKSDLKQRLDDARRAAVEVLGPAYTAVLRVRGQEIEAVVLPDARRSFQEHLGYVWSTLVEDEEWVLQRVGAVTLEKSGIIPKEGALRLKDAVEAFLRFTDKPMIASKDAVVSGIVQMCLDGLVGVGRGTSMNALQARYCRQAVTLDPNEDGVWIFPPFAPDTAESGPLDTIGATDKSPSGGGTGKTVEGETAGTQEAETGTSTSEPRVRRLVIRGTVPVESWGELFRCFVGPAARMNLKALRLGVQFEMEFSEENATSDSAPALKAMREAAQQLRLSFEVED